MYIGYIYIYILHSYICMYWSFSSRGSDAVYTGLHVYSVQVVKNRAKFTR